MFENAMSYIVEEALRFYLLFKDKSNINDLLSDYIIKIIPIISELNQSKIRKQGDGLILEYLFRSKNIKDLQHPTEEELRLCFNQIFNNLVKPEYAFHAFNGNLFESIKNFGVSTEKKITEQYDIIKINQIFTKYGFMTPFGMQLVNCNGIISYSRGQNVSYDYGIRSPEWFSYFCSYNGTHPFKNRDYDLALQNVSKKIASFSEDEKK